MGRRMETGVSFLWAKKRILTNAKPQTKTLLESFDSLTAQMVVSRNRGPSYRQTPKKSIVFIIGTPQKVLIIFGNLKP